MSEIKKPLTKDNPPLKEVNKVEQTFENIKMMNSLEKNELIEKIKSEFKVSEAVAMPQSVAAASEKTEKKTANVSVKVVKIEATGMEKIEAYKMIAAFATELEQEEIRALQAKKRTEEGDKIILTNIPREKAESIKKQLAEKKVEVEIK